MRKLWKLFSSISSLPIVLYPFIILKLIVIIKDLMSVWNVHCLRINLFFHCLWVPLILCRFSQYLFFFCSLGPCLRHVEIPSLGDKLELQLPAYTTATATWDPSRFCNVHHSSQQRPQILNPLSDARDQTRILMDTSQVLYCWATMEILQCFYHLFTFGKQLCFPCRTWGVYIIYILCSR